MLDTSLPDGQEIADAGKEVLIDPSGFYLASPRSVVLLLSEPRGGRSGPVAG